MLVSRNSSSWLVDVKQFCFWNRWTENLLKHNRTQTTQVTNGTQEPSDTISNRLLRPVLNSSTFNKQLMLRRGAVYDILLCLSQLMIRDQGWKVRQLRILWQINQFDLYDPFFKTHKVLSSTAAGSKLSLFCISLLWSDHKCLILTYTESTLEALKNETGDMKLKMGNL